ncbi:Mucin-19 [Camellia lanceoleosa]|nr:Mucin-19 [Camellia lanceoleosa]
MIPKAHGLPVFQGSQLIFASLKTFQIFRQNCPINAHNNTPDVSLLIQRLTFHIPPRVRSRCTELCPHPVFSTSSHHVTRRLLSPAPFRSATLTVGFSRSVTLTVGPSRSATLTVGLSSSATLTVGPSRSVTLTVGFSHSVTLTVGPPSARPPSRSAPSHSATLTVGPTRSATLTVGLSPHGRPPSRSVRPPARSDLPSLLLLFPSLD